MTPDRKPGFMTGLALLLPISLSVMAALFVAPIAPKLGEAFGPTDPNAAWLIPLVITVPSLCVALFSPFVGAWGDRVGRRRLLIWSIMLYVVFGVAPYFLNDLKAIVATRIVVGVVEAMLMTLSTTLIGDFFQQESRNRWLAAQTGLASSTAIICLLVVAQVGRDDWHNVFLLYLLPLLFLGLVLRYTWEPEESAYLQNAGNNLGWADLPWRLLVVICLITLFGSVMFYTVQIKLSDALKAIGVVLADGSYDVASGTLWTVLASLFVPLGTLCYWWLSPRTNLQQRFLIEFVLMGAGFLLMATAKNPLHFALAAGLNQIGAGMLLPTLLTWAVSQLPFAIRGRGTGIWTATFALGQFVCNNAAVPLIMGYTGGILPTIAVLGWLCLAAGWIALMAMVLGQNKGQDLG
jgi:MFS family permease